MEVLSSKNLVSGLSMWLQKVPDLTKAGELNQKLIEVLEKKIQDKLAKIWGENED